MPNALRQAAAPVTTQTPDAELAARGAQGDELAFEAIMRRHNQLLFRTARSMVKSFINRTELKLGYTLAGKTGTAELNDNKTKELAWFICWRDSKDGVKVTAENARLVCIMLEIDLTRLPEEWSQMKFDIARALLKDDLLNETEG